MDGEWPAVLHRGALAIIGAGLVFGVSLAGIGGLWWWNNREEATVEIIKAEETEEVKELWVDVGGAVIRPGVYELKAGSRVKEALAAAGGLAAEADQEYVQRYINLALIVEDGDKLYFPEVNDQINGGGAATSREAGININTATAEELEALSGIGQARAEAIIAGRPYQKTEELVEKKILPLSVYEKIKEKMMVY